MHKSELKSYKIEKLSFTNKTEGVRKLELTHKYSYNVGYSNINTCRGEFTAEIFDKNAPGDFNIVITVIAVFSTEPGASKEMLHLETYDAVFPYVKTLVSTVTASAGIPPVFIPYIDISDKNIYRVELPRNSDGDK